MRIAVIGAGLFGTTAALKLIHAGHHVDLYERHNDILREASGINQFRLHRGYHYPRSIETAFQCKTSEESFLSEYGEAVDTLNSHYYAIAPDSITTTEAYVRFLQLLGLEYSVVNVPWVRNVETVFSVQEHTINLYKLKSVIAKKLYNTLRLNVKLKTEFSIQLVNQYDIIINATYSNINHILPDSQKITYQYEIVQKNLVYLPPRWNGRSIVIMDGEYGCVDPYMDAFMQGWYLGHVREAVLHRFYDTSPEMFLQRHEAIRERLLLSSNSSFGLREGSGEINDDATQFVMYDNYIKIRDELQKYLIDFDPQYLHSKYVIRTVLPDREYDDARPSEIIEHPGTNIISIFSGKLGTCVDIANKIVQYV